MAEPCEKHPFGGFAEDGKCYQCEQERLKAESPFVLYILKNSRTCGIFWEEAVQNVDRQSLANVLPVFLQTPLVVGAIIVKACQVKRTGVPTYLPPPLE